tara:strand:- start:687 stop:1055 length:369 start_codon:yes stop_codon:yes gene_type:complete
MSENDEVYDVARKELDALVSDMTINAATIMQLLKISMEITEATQLKGEEQRKLCIKLVKDVIVAAPLGGKEEQLLLDMIDNGVLDNTVELVVDASQGKLDINAAVGLAQGCCLAFTASSKKN